MTVVEVFKTNVPDEVPAKELVTQLLSIFPKHRINFDLQDCDKILRVEGASIEETQIMNVVKSNGYSCALLEE
ncbi:MAG TPA: hypothetical protein VM935_10575 [Chitinophagaceae bacterium]|jgi:hypothetical protein|nr:hypothetical protein [Chitinophagaceae bacterium]